MELGVAVVGLGVGEQHARAFVRHESCRLRWLFDLDRRRAQTVAAALGQGRIADTLDAIAADGDTQAVSVASFDDAHFEQVVALLDARKHVFVEKPLCRSTAELAEIRRRWERAGQPHVRSNLVLRAAPLYRWLRAEVRSGRLGEIYAFDGDYLYGRLHKITDGWRGRVDDYSVMQGGGVHLVDLMMWITGQRPSRVTAAGNRIATKSTPFRYADFVAATFEFESGLIGRITANFGCVHRHQHVVRVFGTRGTLVYDDLGPRLHESRDPAQTARPLDLAPLPETKGDLIPEFVAGVLEHADPAPPFQSELDVISACLAADQALAAGTRMDIAYV